MLLIDNYELTCSTYNDHGKNWVKKKIEKGHDGDIRNVRITLLNAGKRVIAYTYNDACNYGVRTGYGKQFGLLPL